MANAAVTYERREIIRNLSAIEILDCPGADAFAMTKLSQPVALWMLASLTPTWRGVLTIAAQMSSGKGTPILQAL
ncbi:hypothetical protein QA641_29650 [Bradyrhizobium sp. CB1650]|uniref:hypothetical protein n=1 Tax=Bradyrhizobium sp. CB1650 TaxID=3039153 RepID=UPI002435760B|nr:hypothetical protein [Bradyrhizobium sp. CB1650]WGD49779.1 hypothetical protein QA641_29650 [Bradyrhizobium sp. CB1650]